MATHAERWDRLWRPDEAMAKMQIPAAAAADSEAEPQRMCEDGAGRLDCNASDDLSRVPLYISPISVSITTTIPFHHLKTSAPPPPLLHRHHSIGPGTTLPCGAWWHIGRADAFPPEGRGFESRSSRHIGTLGKSFTYSCL